MRGLYHAQVTAARLKFISLKQMVTNKNRSNTVEAERGRDEEPP
jgi:hypothetical protein